MKSPPIKIEVERIDATMSAILASCFMTSRRGLYGLSTMMLIEHQQGVGWYRLNYTDQQTIQNKLRQAIIENYAGRLPYIGPAQFENGIMEFFDQPHNKIQPHNEDIQDVEVASTVRKRSRDVQKISRSHR